MKRLAINHTGQSGTIISNLNAGVREFSFDPGYHRIDRNIPLPHGTSFVRSKGATLDFALNDYPFTCHGDATFEGMVFASENPNMSLIARASDGVVTLRDVESRIKVVSQPGMEFKAYDSVFKHQTQFLNGSVHDCKFLYDCQIAGNIRFERNLMKRRLLATPELGDLVGAMIRYITWDGVDSFDNAGESFVIECVNMRNCLCENLRFKNGCSGQLFGFWGIDGNNVKTNHAMTNNQFHNFVGEGHSHIGIWLTGAGDISNNLFENVCLNQVMIPIKLECPDALNVFHNLHIVNPVHVMSSAGFHPLPRDWYLIEAPPTTVFTKYDEATNSVVPGFVVQNLGSAKLRKP
jgi:hypothetical protein